MSTRISSAQLQQILAKPGYKIVNEDRHHSIIPNPKPQPDQAKPLDRAAPRKAEGLRRTLVSFTGYRCQPLDPDNFAGSVKDLLDGLRHAGLIPGDEPWRIRLVTDQVKVHHRADEKTVIEIITP